MTGQIIKQKHYVVDPEIQLLRLFSVKILTALVGAKW